MKKFILVPREYDLRSADDETWAIAVGRCQHGFGHCGSDGRCDAGGVCFVQAETLEDAIAELQHLKNELRKTQSQLASLQSKHSLIIYDLEEQRKRAVSINDRDRTFMFSRCIAILKKER